MSTVDPETGEVLDDFEGTLRSSLTEKNHRLHPAADLLPKMTDEEYQALKADIRQNGLRDPVTVTSDNRILDGRHRQQVCDELGIPTQYVTYRGRDPIAFVLSKNLRRRHLSVSQLGTIAADAEEMYAFAAKQRQREGAARGGGRLGPQVGVNRRSASHKAMEDAASAAGVSVPTAERAKRVKRADPDLYQQIKDGEVTVNAAVQKVAQAEILNAPDAGKRDRTAAGSAARREKLTELAARGYNAAQIAKELKISEAGTRNIAREIGVEIVAETVMGRPRRIDPNRVVNETVIGLEGYVLGLDLVEVDQLDKQQIEQWATSLSNSIRCLSRLTKQLKEMARA